uniref:Uncharacterized protein n=1 Tax=Branchiostoma floridae TaxID=7739 RepID=C3ZKF4_BRAFL|eukprot:XP_002591042.1 hypothetical protein BRAFLDRAFT_119076 [Branchiostoma floridae]
MSNMAMALLLLLAAATCTAAADMPAGVDISDVEERSEDPGQNNDYFRRGLDPKAQGAEACLVYKGESYRGKLATTVTGKKCQRWASQTPHSHKYRPDKYESYGLNENYCRNPTGHSAPWCYTMDLGKPWEICNVPGCDCVNYKGTTYRGTIAVTKSGKTCQPWASQTPHSHKYTPVNYLNYGLDQNYCRNPSGNAMPWCYTTDPGKKWDYCDIPGCECVEGTGATYRGTVAVTKSGTPCQRWDSTSPHKPSYAPPDGKDHNYCRNPSRQGMPWCYTTDPGKRWELCDIQPCECRMGKGTSYRGTVAVTKSGKTCQRWDSTSPHKPYFKPQDRKDHNFCRNPDGQAQPWCYTTDPGTRWEFCDIPGCGDSMGDKLEASTHFKVVNIRKTVADAKAYCQAEEKGHLADVTSQRVHDFLGSGGWEWADGTPLSTCSYTNWAPGQPGNIGGQQCVMLKARAGFKWDNAGCSQKKYFICQTGPGDTDACGGQSAREVEADVDPENAFEAMRSSLLQEEAALSDREADKLRRSESEADFHHMVRLTELKTALESETEDGPEAMERLNQISRELGEVWQADEDPDVDEDQADEIPREFSVTWRPEEDPDMPMTALESETEDGPEAMEKLNQISRELGEVWQADEDPDVDEDQADEVPREFSVDWRPDEDPDVPMADDDLADEIPREFSVDWRPEEDPDVPMADDDLADEIPRELGETWEEQEADDVSEDEEDRDAILEELDGLVEELREIVEEKQMEMEEWVDDN